MILSGPAIRSAYESGVIEIDPFDSSQLNPASYDLRLGSEVAVYTPEEQIINRCSDYEHGVQPKGLLDSLREQALTVLQISKYGFTVEPGCLYLMHTNERIHTRCYVSVLDGKSSIGRLGLVVHLTAGYGDPGFNGQYTLEVTSVAHPVRIYPGMRFCQVRFETMKGEAPDYRETGHYVGDMSRGPVRSGSWRQFHK